MIAWAVNVGGFGFLIGSLANLIALRLLGDRRAWLSFHAGPCRLSASLACWATSGYLFVSSAAEAGSEGARCPLPTAHVERQLPAIFS